MSIVNDVVGVFLQVCSHLLFSVLLFEGCMLNEGCATLLVIFIRVSQVLHSLLKGDVCHASGAVHPAVTQMETLENARKGSRNSCRTTQIFLTLTSDVAHTKGKQ